MEKIPPFTTEHLQSIAKVIGDTETGLTGTEIGYFLENCKIPDISPTMTKWKRLYNAFVEFQNQRQFGNHVIVVINKVMNPVQYTSSPTPFSSRQDQLNAILSFTGFYIKDDGKVHHSKKTTNLDEALRRANRLHSALIIRNVHEDVIKFCRVELLQENYFHAVFEAMKSITTKIRDLSGLTTYGGELVQ